MSIETPNFCNAMAALTAAASPTITFVFSAGITEASTTHAAAGVYGFTLDSPLASTECVLLPAVLSAVAAANDIEATHTSAAVKTVTTLVAGAAADTLSFNFMVFQKPNK